MQAIIFDLDGTLLDCREGVFWQFQMLTREFDGAPAPRETIAAAMHGRIEDIVRTLVKNPQPTIEQLVARQVQLRAESEHLQRLYPGVDELLPILQRMGIKVAGLTAGDHRNVDALERHGIAQYFDVIVTAEQVQRSKPDPEGAHLALQRMQVASSEAVIVGDSSADILTGKNAGLAKTIAITHGFGTLDDLRAAAPDHIIGDIPSLLDVIE